MAKLSTSIQKTKGGTDAVEGSGPKHLFHATGTWAPEPRGVVLLETLQAVKVAYKANRGAENRDRLIAAFAAVEEAVRRVQSQLVKLPGTP